MVLQNPQNLDSVFHALADSTRRAMLHQLSAGPKNISELAEPFDMSFPAASKHIRVLEKAGLVSRSVEGRSHICKLEPTPLASADEWLSFYKDFWTKRFDALEALLQSEDAKQ